MTAFAYPEFNPVVNEMLIRPLHQTDIDCIVAVEESVYDFPWTRGNFVDSVAAHYWSQGIWVKDSVPQHCSPLQNSDQSFGFCSCSNKGDLLAYALACMGAAEIHLLNLTVAPKAQRQGLGRYLLDQLLAFSLEQCANAVYLEVRPSNKRAIHIYQRFGFGLIGRRPAYYPAKGNQREDALVMSLGLPQPQTTRVL